MNIFDQFGIKEVADVTLYSIHRKKDGSGEVYYVPALYLDTLKISSVEKSAEGTWAEGGIGNARLICWDYGKQINITLEDALCTPASLGMCWGGILSADWHDCELKIDSSINVCRNPLEKISRMEKVCFPIASSQKQTISKFLPHRFCDYKDSDVILTKSSVVDGVDIRGSGMCRNHTYNWRMVIESAVKSTAVIPDRFFDIKGRHFPINYKKPISVTTPTYDNPFFSVIYHVGSPNKDDMRPPAVIVIDENENSNSKKVKIEFKGYYIDPTGQRNDVKNYIAFLEERKDLIKDYDYVYKGCVIRPCGRKFIINVSDNNGHNFVGRKETNIKNPETFYDSYNNIQNRIPINDGGYIIINEIIEKSYFLNPAEADYLKITIDENNDYFAELGLNINPDAKNIKSRDIYWEKAPYIDVTQFKNIEMWNCFSSINALIYYLITKYENNILAITPVTNEAAVPNDFNENYAQIPADHLEDKKLEGKLHAYLNPQTMQPYDDDYWFHQGEIFYIKSLMLASKDKKIKGKRITVDAGQFPGMYMLIGETYIRDRSTGNDERMQLKFPLCKVKSDQSINLESDGEPITLNIELEVARPESGTMMELTSYETAPRMEKNEKGYYVAIDGSTEVLSE